MTVIVDRRKTRKEGRKLEVGRLEQRKGRKWPRREARKKEE